MKPYILLLVIRLTSAFPVSPGGTGVRPSSRDVSPTVADGETSDATAIEYGLMKSRHIDSSVELLYPDNTGMAFSSSKARDDSVITVEEVTNYTPRDNGVISAHDVEKVTHPTPRDDGVINAHDVEDVAHLEKGSIQSMGRSDDSIAAASYQWGSRDNNVRDGDGVKHVTHLTFRDNGVIHMEDLEDITHLDERWVLSPGSVDDVPNHTPRDNGVINSNVVEEVTNYTPRENDSVQSNERNYNG